MASQSFGRHGYGNLEKKIKHLNSMIERIGKGKQYVIQIRDKVEAYVQQSGRHRSSEGMWGCNRTSSSGQPAGASP
ncbi:hypothetical protein, partial [Streptomyces sp. NPDC058394]|uniref:hypothetical protein n=1 Tax=Streptomyces sp. NPDC058394 TaxID=3346477 RepID=UPI003653025B